MNDRQLRIERKRGKVDGVLANQSLLLGGYTVSLPTFPLLGFTALRQVERRMNVTARHRRLNPPFTNIGTVWLFGNILPPSVIDGKEDGYKMPNDS